MSIFDRVKVQVVVNGTTLWIGKKQLAKINIGDNLPISIDGLCGWYPISVVVNKRFNESLKDATHSGWIIDTVSFYEDAGKMVSILHKTSPNGRGETIEVLSERS